MVQERVLASALVTSATRENCALNAWMSSSLRFRMKHTPFVSVSTFTLQACYELWRQLCVGGGGAGLVPWAEGPLGASLWFYQREAFQSQTHTEKILYNESR